MSSYYRSDDQRERGQRRQGPAVSRQAPRTDPRLSRAPQRPPQRVQREEYSDADYYEAEDTGYRSRVPARQQPEPIVIDRRREERYEDDLATNERYYSAKPRMPRRGILGKALTWGVWGVLGATTIGLTVQEVGIHKALDTDNAKYSPNLPSTYYVATTVGHNGDSYENPTHFTCQNQGGHILILEIPAGDPTKAVLMTGAALMGQNKGDAVVSLNFVVNASGKMDMQVVVSGEVITWTNDGNKFVPPSSSGQNSNLNS